MSVVQLDAVKPRRLRSCCSLTKKHRQSHRQLGDRRQVHIRYPLSIALAQGIEFPRGQHILQLCISQRDEVALLSLARSPAPYPASADASP